MRAGYDELLLIGTTTRRAAVLTGLARATQDRRRHRRKHPVPVVPAVLSAPVNKLTDVEEQHVLAVLNSPRFVDKPPKQIYATLLAEGVYLCSISTMFVGSLY